MLALANKLENKERELILAAVLQSKQDQEYYKYLFSSKGLLEGKEVVDRAYKNKFRYHLIKTTASHVVVALLEWLGWSEEQTLHNNQVSHTYNVTALHPSRPVCNSCALLARYMFKIDLLTNEKGCLTQPFPDSIEALPTLAQQYINSDLTLSLVQQLVVPLMGYVGGMEVRQKEVTLQTQLQEKDTALQQQQEQIAAVQEQSTAVQAQVNQKSKELQEERERMEVMLKLLEEKDQEINAIKNRQKIESFKKRAQEWKSR